VLLQVLRLKELVRDEQRSREMMCLDHAQAAARVEVRAPAQPNERGPPDHQAVTVCPPLLWPRGEKSWDWRAGRGHAH